MKITKIGVNNLQFILIRPPVIKSYIKGKNLPALARYFEWFPPWLKSKYISLGKRNISKHRKIQSTFQSNPNSIQKLWNHHPELWGVYSDNTKVGGSGICHEFSTNWDLANQAIAHQRWEILFSVGGSKDLFCFRHFRHSALCYKKKIDR